jgi:hypothetical protein
MYESSTDAIASSRTPMLMSLVNNIEKFPLCDDRETDLLDIIPEHTFLFKKLSRAKYE